MRSLDRKKTLPISVPVLMRDLHWLRCLPDDHERPSVFDETKQADEKKQNWFHVIDETGLL